MKSALVIQFAVALALSATPARAAACEADTYGAGVTLTEITPVEAVLADPAAWSGRTVRVEGTVREVCRKAGCWMEIETGEGESRLRVKVEDGEIVFPVSARGHHATAEGTVEAVEMSAEELLAWRRHLAEEQGQEPPSEVGPGPHLHVQVRGTGAEICR